MYDLIVDADADRPGKSLVTKEGRFGAAGDDEIATDALKLGQPKALVVIGHEKSEEAGMKYLVEWLEPRLNGVSITHVPSGDPFAWF